MTTEAWVVFNVTTNWFSLEKDSGIGLHIKAVDTDLKHSVAWKERKLLEPSPPPSKKII